MKHFNPFACCVSAYKPKLKENVVSTFETTDTKVGEHVVQSVREISMSESKFLEKYHPDNFLDFTLSEELQAGASLKEVSLRLSNDTQEFDTTQRDNIINEINNNTEIVNKIEL